MASVGKQKVEEPERVGKVLNDIQVVVEKARHVLSGSGNNESLAVRPLSYHPHSNPVSDADMFQALVDENHRLLDQLRVSHPSLEAVRRITGADPYNLATKLTGAGGGGCAVTFIPEGRCSLSTFTLSVSFAWVHAAIPFPPRPVVPMFYTDTDGCHHRLCLVQADRPHIRSRIRKVHVRNV